MRQVIRACIAAALCALSAAAQDASEIDGNYPASAELFGMTPEQFARLGIPEGTRMRPWRRGIIVGAGVYGPPAAVPLPPLPPVVAAPGALIARQTVRADIERWALASAVTSGPPFNTALLAGTAFESAVSIHGTPEPCITRDPKGFKPELDEKQNIYFNICLGGRDAEGRYTTMRFLALYGEKAPLRVLPIAPVRLDPGPGKLDLASQIATRRLRVAAIQGDSARIVMEDAVLRAGKEGDAIEAFIQPKPWRAAGEARLDLRDGATVTLDGVTVTVARQGNAWLLSASGHFVTAFARRTRTGGFDLDPPA